MPLDEWLEAASVLVLALTVTLQQLHLRDLTRRQAALEDLLVAVQRSAMAAHRRRLAERERTP